MQRLYKAGKELIQGFAAEYKYLHALNHKVDYEKNILKELILTTCLQKQEDLIKNYNERVTEMTEDASVNDRSASHSEDRNAGNVEVLNTIEEELEFAQMEMGFLKSLDFTQVIIHVEPGAVVITNQRIFLLRSPVKKSRSMVKLFSVSQQTHLFIKPCWNLKKAGNSSSTASLIR